MENNTIPSSIILDLDLRKGVNSFITNIKSASTGITKRGIFIPLDDNGIVEGGYTDKGTGKVVRTAKMRVRLWHIDEQSKAEYQERYGKEKKQDWDAKLELCKEAREALAQRDPATAARLDRRNDAYDKELSRQLLPYLGVGFSNYPEAPTPEAAPTVEMQQTDADDDLPF